MLKLKCVAMKGALLRDIPWVQNFELKKKKTPDSGVSKHGKLEEY